MAGTSKPVAIVFAQFSGPPGTTGLVEGHYHNALAQIVDASGGRVVKNLPDGVMVVNESTKSAVLGALSMVHATARLNQGALELKVGICLGEPLSDGGDYFGTPVVLARRLCERAEPGQVLCNELIAGLSSIRQSTDLRSLGRVNLKGFSEPVSVSVVTGSAPGTGLPPDPAAPALREAPPPIERTVVASRDLITSFGSGRYVSKRILGRGAQKVVHLVHDTMLERDAALALIRVGELSPAEVERLRREAMTMARFGAHPNIVAVYDFGIEDDQPYVVTERVDHDLRAELTRAGGRLPPATYLSIASDVCAALASAHEQGIVHRDVKPENILLTPFGTAKLADFGIALVAGATRLSVTGAITGSAPYLSPEQALGADVDSLSDVYSLGATLYEMATGRPPFVGDELLSVISQHVHGEPRPPMELNPDVDAAISGLIMRMLAKKKGTRPSAQEVLAYLGERRNTRR